MDLQDKINRAWTEGAKGTQEVPLKPGIEFVLNNAKLAEEKARQQAKVKKQDEQVK